MQTGSNCPGGLRLDVCMDGCLLVRLAPGSCGSLGKGLICLSLLVSAVHHCILQELRSTVLCHCLFSVGGLFKEHNESKEQNQS
jgi:hypothetical protein